MALPAWLASMTQVPAAAKVTTPRRMQQIPARGVDREGDGQAPVAVAVGCRWLPRRPRGAGSR